MSPETEPGPGTVTTGEIYRRQTETLQEIRDMRRDLIGRAEYEADQEGHVAQHKDLREKITEVQVSAKTELTDAKTEATTQVGNVAAELNTLRRNMRAALAGVGTVLLAVLTVVLPHVRWGS